MGGGRLGVDGEYKCRKRETRRERKAIWGTEKVNYVLQRVLLPEKGDRACGHGEVVPVYPIMNPYIAADTYVTPIDFQVNIDSIV